VQNLFAAPWVLLGLPFLLLLPGRERRGPWLLRVLTLALLLVALAQPSLEFGAAPLGVLVDVSESVGSAAQEAAAPLRSGMSFVFAGDTAAGDTATASGDAPPSATAQLGTERTDIGRALQVAAASGAGRMLLVSDGAESQGDALAALPEVPVDVLYTPSRGNVRLRELLAPGAAQPGAQTEVVAVVESDRDTVVTLRPRVGGRELPAVQRRVFAGQTPLRFSVSWRRADRGVLSVEASLELPFEQPLQDDLARAEIDVAEDDPVLVIGDPALSQLLSAQGFSVVRGGSRARYRAAPVQRRHRAGERGGLHAGAARAAAQLRRGRGRPDDGWRSRELRLGRLVPHPGRDGAAGLDRCSQQCRAAARRASDRHGPLAVDDHRRADQARASQGGRYRRRRPRL
jgi:hypothetical protein